MQHLSTSHGTFLPIALRTCWNLLLDALMWPRMIDVRGVLLQHPLQMPLMHAQHVVETFLTHGSHPALRNGMCRWCPDGRADDRHVVSREHLVKGRRKRGITIRDQDVDRYLSCLRIPSGLFFHATCWYGVRVRRGCCASAGMIVCMSCLQLERRYTLRCGWAAPQ